MNWIEVVKASAEVVIAVFTIVLAYATCVLAKHTRMLDSHELERRRLEDIRKTLSIVEAILTSATPSTEVFGDTKALFHLFNDLLALGKYIHDDDTRRQLEQITSRFSATVVDGLNPLSNETNFADAVDRFRRRLAQEFVYLQRDLGNYSMLHG